MASTGLDLTSAHAGRKALCLASLEKSGPCAGFCRAPLPQSPQHLLIWRRGLVAVSRCKLEIPCSALGLRPVCLPRLFSGSSHALPTPAVQHQEIATLVAGTLQCQCEGVLLPARKYFLFAQTLRHFIAPIFLAQQHSLWRRTNVSLEKQPSGDLALEPRTSKRPCQDHPLDRATPSSSQRHEHGNFEMQFLSLHVAERPFWRVQKTHQTGSAASATKRPLQTSADPPIGLSRRLIKACCFKRSLGACRNRGGFPSDRDLTAMFAHEAHSVADLQLN